MYLIQLMLPLSDNHGQPIPEERHTRTVEELKQHFGGVTAYPQKPAEGLWKLAPGKAEHGKVMVYEVTAAHISSRWWAAKRAELEKRFHQIISIRCSQVTR